MAVSQRGLNSCLEVNYCGIIIPNGKDHIVFNWFKKLFSVNFDTTENDLQNMDYQPTIVKEPEHFRQSVLVAMTQEFKLQFIRHEYKGKKRWYSFDCTTNKWHNCPASYVYLNSKYLTLVEGVIVSAFVHPISQEEQEEMRKLVGEGEGYFKLAESIVKKEYPLPVEEDNIVGSAYRCRIFPNLDKIVEFPFNESKANTLSDIYNILTNPPWGRGVWDWLYQVSAVIIGGLGVTLLIHIFNKMISG